MSIEIECRHCSQPFVPTLQELKRGPQYYRFCSDVCRKEAELAATVAAAA